MLLKQIFKFFLFLFISSVLSGRLISAPIVIVETVNINKCDANASQLLATPIQTDSSLIGERFGDLWIDDNPKYLMIIQDEKISFNIDDLISFALYH